MKDAYYFPHDSNAKDDPNCIMLIEELGLEGYGIFWMLIETLRDQPEYRAPISMIPGLARRYNSTAEKVKAVVLRYQLFKVDDAEFFFSESLKRRMEFIDDKRQKRSIAGRKGNEVRWGSQSDRNRIASKVKESKVKESKGNSKREKKEPPPPNQIPLPETVEQVVKIGNMKTVPPEQCENYFHLRSTDNFMRMDKNGNWKPILNWHSDLHHLYLKGALEKQKNYKNDRDSEVQPDLDGIAKQVEQWHEGQELRDSESE